MEYMEIFQSYCILNVSGAEIETWGTSPAKLKDFENDESQVKKDFRNLVSFKTTFVKGNDCREASDLLLRHIISSSRHQYMKMIMALTRMS